MVLYSILKWTSLAIQIQLFWSLFWDFFQEFDLFVTLISLIYIQESID